MFHHHLEHFSRYLTQHHLSQSNPIGLRFTSYWLDLAHQHQAIAIGLAAKGR